MPPKKGKATQKKSSKDSKLLEGITFEQLKKHLGDDVKESAVKRVASMLGVEYEGKKDRQEKRSDVYIKEKKVMVPRSLVTDGKGRSFVFDLSDPNYANALILAADYAKEHKKDYGIK